MGAGFKSAPGLLAGCGKIPATIPLTPFPLASSGQALARKGEEFIFGGHPQAPGPAAGSGQASGLRPGAYPFFIGLLDINRRQALYRQPVSQHVLHQALQLQGEGHSGVAEGERRPLRQLLR